MSFICTQRKMCIISCSSAGHFCWGCSCCHTDWRLWWEESRGSGCRIFWKHENSENSVPFWSASTYPSVSGTPTKDSVLQMLLRLLAVSAFWRENLIGSTLCSVHLLVLSVRNQGRSSTVNIHSFSVRSWFGGSSYQDIELIRQTLSRYS